MDCLEIVRDLLALRIPTYFKKEYIRTDGNSLFSRDIRLFLYRFVV